MSTVHGVAESDMTEPQTARPPPPPGQGTVPTGVHTPFQAAVAVSEPQLPTQLL